MDLLTIRNGNLGSLLDDIKSHIMDLIQSAPPFTNLIIIKLIDEHLKSVFITPDKYGDVSQIYTPIVFFP